MASGSARNCTIPLCLLLLLALYFQTVYSSNESLEIEVSDISTRDVQESATALGLNSTLVLASDENFDFPLLLAADDTDEPTTNVDASIGEGRSLRAARRPSRSSTQQKLLGFSWHYTVLVRYLARKTSCAGSLGRATSSLVQASKLIKAGQRAKAAASVQQASRSTVTCARVVKRNKKLLLYLGRCIKLNSLVAKSLRTPVPRPHRSGSSRSHKRRPTGHKRKPSGHKRRPTGHHKHWPHRTPSKTTRPKQIGGAWRGHTAVGHSSGFTNGGTYGNPIDDCWLDAWPQNPQKLASCAQGYGENAKGGAGGRIYVVSTNDDSDIAHPAPGTLRYAASLAEPLWITFDRDLTFELKAEILIFGRKTIDGRGVTVTFKNGPGLAVEYVSNVIIHNVRFYNNIGRRGHIEIRDGPGVNGRDEINGYGVYIYQSTDVWIDHCDFAISDDTLIDVIAGTTDVTISNSYFTQQDKVILMGHQDGYSVDEKMRVTVMLNTFGPNCMERMPRGRYGTFHVLNNYYPNGWGIYAIGGSSHPTFQSENNFFVASDDRAKKEVTKVIVGNGDNWNWGSKGDIFVNGAFFTATGSGFTPPYNYDAVPARDVPRVTSRAGLMLCDESRGTCTASPK